MQDPISSTIHPMCPDCRKPMRVVATAPGDTHALFRRTMFVCDCGRASDQMIAPVNPGGDAPNTPDVSP